MASEGNPNARVGNGNGFKSKLNHFLYSGDKKHVFAGLTIITAIFAVPWYYMSRGSKHQSHQDYLEKADKARSARLSSSSAK
ncbi:hypothetical protein BVRB_8g189330 [Beta vulgaris subsp. vulgaris]|uniref:uncharacterized protein LOC104901431 n=1 Tax=Beta vulgaris subsp. vulgaris TaxID=3555 RepID=UPI00053F41BC|nr:uncharacterized protein LOC104901431 [Beta vulgaris subsp. vulgaris]KMT03788.1 hypothetical protein BVRB_8g189330 [Beta vulgaris subsp. vulgaris]